MSITVNWNGTETAITSSNAYAIYEDWVQGEIDLSTAQIKMCESFLTDEEIEEIEYENGGDEKTGAAAIGEDAENAENSSNQTGNAAATSVGMTATAAGAAVLAKLAVKKSLTSGFVALGMGAAIAACALLCQAFVKAFDSDYNNRTQAKGNADSTNSTLDGYTSSLEENFDSMNEDSDAYAEATDVYTTAVNENVSKKANLQVQLQAAQAAGDLEGVESLESEIEACDEEAKEITTDEMDEIQENMEAYGSLGSEAGGAAGAGQSVSDFLKEGTPLGVVGYLNMAFLAVATVMAGLSIASAAVAAAKDAASLNFAGAAAGFAGAVLFALGAVLLGTATNNMRSKAKEEMECGSSGRDMQGHVNTLNDMIGEHSEYMDATSESYDETDAESQESQSEAAEAAAEVTAGGGTSGTVTSDDEDTDKETV